MWTYKRRPTLSRSLRVSASQSRGVTLIMVAGVLAVLAAMGAGFYTISIVQAKSAARYSDSVRAEFMVQAGFSYAVANLLDEVYKDTENPRSAWFTVDYLHNKQRQISFPKIQDDKTLTGFSAALGNTRAFQSDRFTLSVEDAAGKININACDNLAVVLDNLCRCIGSPLVAANLDMIQPKRWADEGADAGLYDKNSKDTSDNVDLYFQTDGNGRPLTGANGVAIYGDGYAIAGYRSKHGKFSNIDDVKLALTYYERNNDGYPSHPLEQLEIELKFAALRPYITIDSWVDTNTVCVGKFEWASETSVKGDYYQVLIDRDKSWVADDITNDPDNLRGSLRGSYVSIVNGHGAGQLRRIATNGTDWIAIRLEEKMVVSPGPCSSYILVAAEEAMLQAPTGETFAKFPAKLPPAGTPYLPQTNADGSFVPNPKINYKRNPLCIHRAPVNLNTASEKVLAALFMGLNVQHGSSLAVGTDADLAKLSASWFIDNSKSATGDLESRLATFYGLKRIPAAAGKIVFNRPMPTKLTAAGYQFDYLNNFGSLDPAGTPSINEAQELAYRVILAHDKDPKFPYMDVVALTVSGGANAANVNSYPRGPFRTWDDLYFRVIKPWDDVRTNNGLDTHKASVARMLMAHFNPNTDLLKFNPNIEWINRWGRNFTEMEPVMIYTNSPGGTAVANPIKPGCVPIYMIDKNRYIMSSKRFPATQGAFITRNYRYKADEMIDKSDMNRSTTEFSFDSNGIFEIRSTGQIVSGGEVAAERQSTGLVQVYDVWRETTQHQFARGHMSKALGDPGSTCSGQVARDAYNVKDRLALITQPEPLVPLQYTIRSQVTGQANGKNQEVVDSGVGGGRKRNVFALPVDINQPDVVANRVQPAVYDGQITLATNTSGYDPNTDKDTFLASFDGDLDTADCAGNGHEQAKYPHIDTGPYAKKGSQFRVVGTSSLLGIMNDTLIATDPGLPGNRLVYYFVSLNAGLTGLDPNFYYNNVTVRRGDLRTDGAYLSNPGVSGNSGTLKYLFGANKENFQTGSQDGNCVSMWIKPTWDQGDFRTHELFNASNPGTQLRWSRGLYFYKTGQYVFSFNDLNPGAGHSANRYRTNDLSVFWEADGIGTADFDFGGYLYGGYDWVTHPAAPAQQESPAYRIQPFRWSFTGFRRNVYSQSLAPQTPGGPTGHLRQEPSRADYKSQGNLSTIQSHIRPFVDTQLNMEGQKTWKPDFFWCFRSYGSGIEKSQPAQVGNQGALNAFGSTGQDVKWDWADPAGVTNNAKVFSINNLNYGGMSPSLNDVYYHYRYMPDDGTFAVIDELKISSRDRVLNDSGSPDWARDRIVREQALSRYYLPPSPSTSTNLPVFTSQSMLQSINNVNTPAVDEQVTVLRASWTVFTPRFMHEYKTPSGQFKRTEYVTYLGGSRKPVSMPFKGPFDYEFYNDDNAIDNTLVDESGRIRRDVSVNRPAPSEYGKQQTFDTRGVEVELIDSVDGNSDTSGKILGTTLVDPNALNQIGTVAKPVRVATSHLRYRVRFKYPVNPLVDPKGGTEVDPSKQYLLDTPVFDDISISYSIRPRIIWYKMDTE